MVEPLRLQQEHERLVAARLEEVLDDRVRLDGLRNLVDRQLPESSLSMSSNTSRALFKNSLVKASFSARAFAAASARSLARCSSLFASACAMAEPPPVCGTTGEHAITDKV